MESFEAVIRHLLARIQALQIPRKVPSVEELRTDKSGRRLYRTTATAWGVVPADAPAGESQGAVEPRSKSDRRGPQAERRFPQVRGVPTPRGLLACHPPRSLD